MKGKWLVSTGQSQARVKNLLSSVLKLARPLQNTEKHEVESLMLLRTLRNTYEAELLEMRADINSHLDWQNVFLACLFRLARKTGILGTS